MALSHSIGSETQKPLAVVIIGRLISATVLTLILLPTLYLIFEGQNKPRISVPEKSTGSGRGSEMLLESING
ncbi:MAG: efflux RND transporter permease subunit [Acidobacteria bacterium]|nr:efflux RND transporter permease subunit [Acidobacteriota bacterium]